MSLQLFSRLKFERLRPALKEIDPYLRSADPKGFYSQREDYEGSNLRGEPARIVFYRREGVVVSAEKVAQYRVLYRDWLVNSIKMPARQAQYFCDLMNETNLQSVATNSKR